MSLTIKTTEQWGTGSSNTITIVQTSAISNPQIAIAFKDPNTRINWIDGYTVSTDSKGVYVLNNVSWNTSIPIGSTTIALGTNQASPVIIAYNIASRGDVVTPGTGSGIGSTTVSFQEIDDTTWSKNVVLNDTLTLTPKGFTLGKYYTNNPAFVLSTSSTGALVIKCTKASNGCIKIYNGVSYRLLGLYCRSSSSITNDLDCYNNRCIIGSVSEDDPLTSMTFWADFEDPNPLKGKRVDSSYIYLNNGASIAGSYSWRYNYSTKEMNSANGGVEGQRAIISMQNRQRLGMTPTFVWYNIPDGGESYTTDLAHMQDAVYMKAYFDDLMFLLGLINKYSPKNTVQLILEPDSLNYLMQNEQDPTKLVAQVADAIKAVAPTAPVFPNTVTGLVSAVNYLISTTCPQVRFGWQTNLWGSVSPSNNLPAGTTSLMKVTDQLGIDQGRLRLIKEATTNATYIKKCGVLTYGAHFVSVDKYGLDFRLVDATSLTNADKSAWGYNHDHWINYLTYVKAIGDVLSIPMVLWQLPVGHLNTSQTTSAYTNTTFANLPNTSGKAEDSTSTFFLGDTFKPLLSNEVTYWQKNDSKSSSMSVAADGSITWSSALGFLKNWNISQIMSGAGVGNSTTNVGNPTTGLVPGDSYYWIQKVQKYLQ